jgi:tetratricopeptide (TPR) repeat protein
MVRDRLLDWVADNRLRPCFRLLEILAELRSTESRVFAETPAADDEFILKSVLADLTGGTGGEVSRAVSEGRLEKVAGTERAETLAYIVQTQRALIHGDEAEIRDAFAVPPPEPYAPYRTRILVNLTSYHLGVRDAASAVETVKEAVVLSQGNPWMGLAQAYRLFSLANLARQKVAETIDYAGFAVENAEKSGNIDELGVSLYYAAAAQFLYGNVSKADRLVIETCRRAEQTGRPEWADRARFLMGKLRFETGRYRDALDIFESLRKASGAAPEKKRILAAWVYRAKIYSQSPLIQKPDEGGPDADLFEIEASYLAENYGRTAELCSRFTAPSGQFVFIEQPDWRSGFAQCELLLLPAAEFWDRTVSVYHSLALCRLSPASAGEAVRSMQRIVREEGLSDMDPNGAFYLYAFYRILEDSGAPQVDMNTAVSMAFKRLQRRASRIDDMETRRNFLSLPRWNSALSLAARDYKLI